MSGATNDRPPGSGAPGGSFNHYSDPSTQPRGDVSYSNGDYASASGSNDASSRSRGDERAGGDAESRPRRRDKDRKTSGPRICGKCNLSLTGQFVRALGDTYHLECFTCHDCGKVVASKFFPVPDTPPGQYPLCETDYFRRLDLLCHSCGGALRGSYITALERKYHIEHFTCSVCPTVFGASDSYYEHDGNVYCHYHYSSQFAQKCDGCQTAILKQFVEIFRNGQDQHWHPECYMIHKYWNVRLHSSSSKAAEQPSQQQIMPETEASEEMRKHVRTAEEAVEYKVHWIWQTLSTFEERSATCISDMLLHVSNGAYMDGVVAARKFITHVDLLFAAADDLDTRLQRRPAKGQEARTQESSVHSGLNYSREAKLLCKKVVSFFQLLAESQDTGVRRLGVTQELLSLVTGLAHYLKLMIRICLSGALKLERETTSPEGLEGFLSDISKLDERLELDENRDLRADTDAYVDDIADACLVCSKSVEDKCFRRQDRMLHVQCVACSKCGRELQDDPGQTRWSDQQQKLFCQYHATPDSRTAGLVPVSRLRQYVHLLRVAHARLLANLRTSGALPHTSDDPNLTGYDSREGHTLSPNNPPLLRSNTRSRSYAGRSSQNEKQTGASSYEEAMGDIRRLRSTRMDKQLSNANQQARTSRIIDGPRSGSPGSHAQRNLQIVQDPNALGDQVAQLNFGRQDAMTLDDIPRIVQAQQTREQRPNASRFARQPMIPQDPKPKFVNGSHTRDFSGGAIRLEDRPAGTKRYFSELTALEYFIVRHVAVLSMEPLLEGHFNQEELLDLIETKRPTFWSKFGKAFVGKEKRAKGSKTAIFGVSLDQLLERDYEESTDGVGPGSLKIPSLVQEAISAMKTMDMSVEGVFRKNGNIKRLNDVKEEIDTKGVVDVDLTKENAVQVAALLKKFLREMPDPLLTHKLHKLWITSQRIEDLERRRRVLHLTCCLLPKPHRDTMEVLFTFLNWVSSFSHVDEESGSKMDIHNLATVITPNIIHRGKENMPVDDSFLAIEAVNSLIECNESMCEVPEDLALILNDSSLFSNNAEITTKEILKRYGDRAKAPSVSTPAHNASKADAYGEVVGSGTITSRDSDVRVASSGSGAGVSTGNGKGGAYHGGAASGNGYNASAQGYGHGRPGIQRVDTDPNMATAWSNESSVRHVAGDHPLASGGASGSTSALGTPVFPFAGGNGSGNGRRGSGESRSESPSRFRVGGEGFGGGNGGGAGGNGGGNANASDRERQRERAMGVA